jgi:hypothetical protein
MKKITLAFFILLSILAHSQDKAVLNLANDNDYTTFSVFENLGIENYNLFFTGEDHRYPLSNSDIELKMFKYLHQKAGVRVFLLEFGGGMAYFINKYISEGDSLAKSVLKINLKNSYFNLFDNLKDFYDTLPASEKFSVRGIDIEREPMYAVKYLELLLPNTNECIAADSIRVHIDAIKAVSEYYSDAQRNWGRYDDDFDFDEPFAVKEGFSPYLTIEKVIQNFNAHKEKYAVLLQENFSSFSTAINWLEVYYYWSTMNGTAQMYLYRETYMEQNLEEMFTANPALKAYGQFGRCHTAINREKEECNYYYFNALATRLNNGNHPQLKDKVFSCPIFYPASFTFRKETKIDKDLKRLAKETDKNKISVFAFDTAKFEGQKKLARRFNAVIINNLQKDKSVGGITGEDDSFVSDYDFHASNERLLLLADGGFKNYNFSDVNNVLKTNFKNQQQFIGFSIAYTENNGFNTRSSVLWFPSTESKPNDSTTITIKGFAASMRYAKDVLKSKKYDLNLGIGYGFERWTNTVTETFTDETRKDVLGNNRTTRFVNPAFFMDAGLDFNVHISWVTLGFFSRYQFDFSNRRWRQNNVIVANSPAFSLSSYTIGASLGFNLEL